MSVPHIDFFPPSQDGVNFRDPTDVADYLSSFAGRVRDALDQLTRQMNNPRHIIVDGKPLANSSGSVTAWQPGDVKLTWGYSGVSPSLPSRSAMKNQRWVICDGTNGTLDMTDAFAVGATTVPGAESGGTVDITSGVPSSLVNVMRTCDTQARAGDDVHTHDTDVDGGVKAVTFVFLMRV